jgi:hypothetical protein
MLLSCGAPYVYMSWCSGTERRVFIFVGVNRNRGFANPVNAHMVFGEVNSHRSSYRPISVNGTDAIRVRQVRARWPAR